VRLGIVSDVHANLEALRRAVDRLRRDAIDVLVCAGDIVGYGPQPNECIELLEELGAVAVAGNHDLLALGHLDPSTRGTLDRQSASFSRRMLSSDSRKYLAALPRRAILPGVVVAHGSLDDTECYVTRPTQMAAQLVELRRTEDGASVLVLGHTHRALLFAPDGGVSRPPPGGATMALPPGQVLVNPGSVGQSRQLERTPRARFALLDVGSRSVRFYTEPYDVRARARTVGARPLNGDTAGTRSDPTCCSVVRAHRRRAGRVSTKSTT
jgi:putative phosphoesterase